MGKSSSSTQIFNTPPNINSLEALEKQRFDVTDYSFSSFTYSRLASERYSADFSSSPFSSMALGSGQVLPTIISRNEQLEL
uniref:Uncharacterized protein n=1 Tax=Ditylenchus dipsaci TaxID=166011 RepID=A0A915DMJ6_9BILA